MSHKDKDKDKETDVYDNLDSFLGVIERLEKDFSGWEEKKREAVFAYRKAIETLHKEAIRQIIRRLSEEPVATEILRSALANEVVYAVLRNLQLVRPSIQERVNRALDQIRPMLASHGGDVELVSVILPDTVEVKFLGACDGCSASMLTFVSGVKKVISEECPDLVNIVQVKSTSITATGAGTPVKFISPFALGQGGDWKYAVSRQKIPDGGVLNVNLEGHDLLMSRNGRIISCFQNACAHLGMPMHNGRITDGVITCPYHDFKYDLRTGQCITAPEVQLHSYAVRVIGNKVEVRI